MYTGYLNGREHDLTVDEYLGQADSCKTVVSADDLGLLIRSYEELKRTKPQKITKEAYHWYLEVLPPCRWKDDRFHVSERITGQLVRWCMQKGDEYYTFIDYDYITDEQIDNIYRGIN